MRYVPHRSATKRGELTNLNRRILSLMCHGLSNRQIGQWVGLDEEIVRRQVFEIYWKVADQGLDPETRHCRTARREGAVSIDSRASGGL